jgi:hypothetical protein
MKQHELTRASLIYVHELFQPQHLQRGDHDQVTKSASHIRTASALICEAQRDTKLQIVPRKQAKLYSKCTLYVGYFNLHKHDLFPNCFSNLVLDCHQCHHRPQTQTTPSNNTRQASPIEKERPTQKRHTRPTATRSL